MSDLPGFDNYFNLAGKVALVTGGTSLPSLKPHSISTANFQ
jgi:hypothetical protein